MTSGENNPRAVLSDDEVDRIRDLYEQDRGKPRVDRYWTAPRLAEKFEISLRHVWYVLSYSRRAGGMEDSPEKQRALAEREDRQRLAMERSKVFNKRMERWLRGEK